jgi:hypothetical protein
VLVVVAARAARDQRHIPRQRDAVTLIVLLAAALAASPIVWVHFFLLMLVPLALMQPRLSVLWFLPLAYYPLGETAWPAGDARKLSLALVTTLILFVATLHPAPVDRLWQWARTARPGRSQQLRPRPR